MEKRVVNEWQEFFEKHRDYTVQSSFYECRQDFTMEELYQAFKARLIAEVVAVQQLRDGIHQIFPLRGDVSAGAEQK